MKGHGTTNLKDRSQAILGGRQELQGRLPRGPFEFAEDLSFDGLDPEESDPPAVRRFKLAVARDCRHASAGAPFLALFGLSQGLRAIYDGGGQLQDGGARLDD